MVTYPHIWKGKRFLQQLEQDHKYSKMDGMLELIRASKNMKLASITHNTNYTMSSANRQNSMNRPHQVFEHKYP